MDNLTTVIRRAADLSGIAKGAKLTGRIETLNNVHALYFYLTGSGTALTSAQIITDIGDVRIRINGELIFEASGDQIQDLYKYHFDANTAHTVAGCLCIPFVRPHLPMAGLKRGLALGMLADDGQGQNVLTYEVNVLSPGTLTLDAGNVLFEHDKLAPEKLGAHIRVLRHTRTFSATGVQEIVDLPKDKPGTAALAYHFDKGNVTHMTVKVSGRDWLETTPYEVMKTIMHKAGRVPQASWTHVPFDLENDLGAALPLGSNRITSLLVKPTWSVSPAGSYEILAEEMHSTL